MQGRSKDVVEPFDSCLAQLQRFPQVSHQECAKGQVDVSVDGSEKI
jgi:hypothetical protein